MKALKKDNPEQDYSQKIKYLKRNNSEKENSGKHTTEQRQI